MHLDLSVLLVVFVCWFIYTNTLRDWLDFCEAFKYWLTFFSFKHFLGSIRSFKWLDSI